MQFLVARRFDNDSELMYEPYLQSAERVPIGEPTGDACWLIFRLRLDRVLIHKEAPQTMQEDVS